jgi:antitoxin component YwqK of YwqJK toxin-antitoxin module
MLVLLLVLTVGLLWVGAVKNDDATPTSREQKLPGSSQAARAVIHYFDSGEIHEQIQLRGGREHGKMVSWYRNGQRESEIEFRHGTLHGDTTFWYENGKKRLSCRFNNGDHHGRVLCWDENGNLSEEAIFRNGVLIFEKSVR